MWVMTCFRHSGGSELGESTLLTSASTDRALQCEMDSRLVPKAASSWPSFEALVRKGEPGGCWFRSVVRGGFGDGAGAGRACVRAAETAWPLACGLACLCSAPGVVQ